MKKLFAYITLWLTAITSSVSYSNAGDVPFQSADSYYNGAEHNTVDYKELYESYVEDDSTAANGCKLTRRTPQKGINNQAKGPTGALWIVYGKEIIDETSKKDVSLNCQSGDILIAPAGCTILTDAKSSNHGTYMQISMGNGSYVITLNNMDKWYCCLDRPDSERQSDGYFQHTKNAKGTKLRAGDIIGCASEKTTISIKRVSDGKEKAISLHTYYYGT